MIQPLGSEVIELSITWIIVTIAATLVGFKLYRASPFYDSGFAIWSTPDEQSMRTAKRIFSKYGSRPTFDFGDEAVARQAFANAFDVINCTRDARLGITLEGVYAARAYPVHSPHRAASEVADLLKRDGKEVTVLYDPDSHVKKQYMAFVIVEGQGWMYVFRRHKFLMMIDQKSAPAER